MSGKPINNLVVVSKRDVMAFEHSSKYYAHIELETKNTYPKPWPLEKETVVTGATLAPCFNGDELSFIYIRDETTIKLMNT